MSDQLKRKIDVLTQLNLVLRKQLELAELQIPEINKQVEALAALRAFDQLAIEGDVIAQLPFMPNAGSIDSCQVYQAVLLVPLGVGAVVCDLEDHLERQRNPADESSIRGRCQSFDGSSSYIRAALLPRLTRSLSGCSTRSVCDKAPTAKPTR